jgi:bacterioferritin-associated ferredoxin
LAEPGAGSVASDLACIFSAASFCARWSLLSSWWLAMMSAVLTDKTAATPTMAMTVNGSALACGTCEKAARTIIVKAMTQARFFIASSMNHLKKKRKAEKTILAMGLLLEAEKNAVRQSNNKGLDSVDGP